jgi:SAM-dependent methyltransferase
MMFGTREKFAYLECTGCGCVQISQYPVDIGRHYPPEYYAFGTQNSKLEAPPSALARSRRRVKQAVLDWFPIVRRRYLTSASSQRWLERNPSVAMYVGRIENPAAHILDVGCGDGNLPMALYDFYYRNASGVDSFVAADVHYQGRLLVRRASLHDLDGSFDCISFNHALEHMPQQLRVFTDARKLLAPGGFLLVRIPVVGSYAWRTYGENWVQLDAPRHYYLHSTKSISLLAANAGLRVDSITSDSTGFQFWGSELYCRDIPLTDPRSPFTPGGSMFSQQQLAEYASHAAELNATGDGDQVVVILSHTEEHDAGG